RLSDHGIFIKHINTLQTNDRLEIGDRLLQISSMCNTYDLRFVTFEMAKKYIESACALNQMIKLCIGRSRSPVQSENEVLVSNERNFSNSGMLSTAEIEQSSIIK
ncbi:unnamed protein product, partial [Adineta steineri]